MEDLKILSVHGNKIDVFFFPPFQASELKKKKKRKKVRRENETHLQLLAQFITIRRRRRHHQVTCELTSLQTAARPSELNTSIGTSDNNKC